MEGLQERLKSRILLLDGAMGTCLMNKGLMPSDYGGSKYEGCNEILSIKHPEIVRSVHEDYLLAGADIIETNTFSGSPISLSEFGLDARSSEINLASAKIAREAADKFSTRKQPRYVAGSIGSTSKSLSVTGGVKYEEMRDSYLVQARALEKGEVDFFLVETIFDTLNAKAAYSAFRKLFSETGRELPTAFSFTIEQSGVMLAGQDIEAAYTSIAHANPLAVGLNCGLGPDLMQRHLMELSSIANTNIICYPNAGLPKEDGTFPLTPLEFAKLMKGIMRKKLANIVGGCCGTTPEHIAALRKMISSETRRIAPKVSRSALSGIEAVVIDNDTRPVIVGERTNSIGSKRFRELIASGEFEIAAEIGRAQVEKGANVLDICLANPDRDEPIDTEKFYEIVVKKVKVPLMVDSTNSEAIERALMRSQGKCIINSLNFEDGFMRAKAVMPLVKEYGAAIIFGTIDEDGQQAMAKTPQKKLVIARRARDYLVKEWGLPEEDIVFDPLTFPVASGDAKYSGSAKATIAAISKLKREFPKCKTVLGVS
ncbi:MAG: homocysteine S-methyltransferase family protein, partial [Candidatus Micrarchaeota archaeon]